MTTLTGEKAMHSIKSFTRILCVLAIMMASIGIVSVPSKPAYASCCSCACDCIRNSTLATQAFMTAGLVMHQNWMVDTFWYGNILPAMMMMTNQLSAVAMQQVQIIGTFMDAQMQMETQQLLQRLQAEAHKDYQPSEGLCTIGTGVQNLAASERKGDLNNIVLSKRMLDRQLRNQNTVGSIPDGDLKSRIRQYATVFCNPSDNNGQLANLCGANGGPLARQNKDIDYTRTIDIPLTLDIDFTDGNVTPDEADVLALTTNLFGNDLIAKDFQLDMNDDNDGNEETFMDYRALIAKRNLAQSALNKIIGMKSAGSGIDSEYLNAILLELGMPEGEATRILGENPSYYAQMELLSKKIYQNPQFYVNLYDKPANVARKGVAMQAIELMLKNDTFNVGLDQSLLTGVAVSLEIDKSLEALQNRVNPQ